MLDRFFRYVVHYPKIILSIVIAITIFLALFIPKLKIDFSIEHLFSQNDPNVEKYFSFRDTFGREDNVITIIYKPKNIYDKNLYIELEDLTYKIESLDEVKSIASIFTLSDIDENAWLGDLYDGSYKWDEKNILKKQDHWQIYISLCQVLDTEMIVNESNKTG